MEQNTQNNSTKNDKIQILITSDQAPIFTLLTISETKLKELGITEPKIEGVYVHSEHKPSAPQYVWNYNAEKNLTEQINQILDASIVNSEQRRAVKALIIQAIRQQEASFTNNIHYNIKYIQDKPTNAQGFDGVMIEQC